MLASEYYPAALNLLSKWQQPSTLLFLQTYPTPQAAQAASLQEITTTLRAGKQSRAAQYAPKIFEELHRPQLVANEIVDQEISTLFLTHPDQSFWRALPDAGSHLAPRLLAEWSDDRSRYANASCVAALAAMALVPFQSGNFAKAHKRFACLKPLRNHLQQFAWQSTKQEAWALAYYQRKRAEGKTHSMALRALANVWVRIVRHVATPNLLSDRGL